MTRILDTGLFDELADRDAESLRAPLLTAATDRDDLREYLGNAKELVLSPRGTDVLRAMSAALHAPADAEPTDDVRRVARTERIVNDWMVVSSVASLFLGPEHEVTGRIRAAQARYAQLFSSVQQPPEKA